MRHAGSATLAALEPLLQNIRAMAVFREPRPGVFYRRRRAALHFHEDAAGLFADYRGPDEADFTRLPVDRATDREALLALLAGSSEG